MQQAVNKTNQRRRQPQPWRAALLVLCVLSSLWSGWHLWHILAEDSQSSMVLRSLQAYVTYMDPEPASGTAAQGISTARPQTGAGTSVVVDAPCGIWSVDFAGLAAACPGVQAWIWIPGTNISQPVLQAEDNSWYLTHGPDGRENRAGSIFLDCRNAADFGDVNSVIYGHRMNNGSMFAGLHAFCDAAFREAHPYIFLMTPAGERRYEVFEVSETDADLSRPAYRIQFEDAAAATHWAYAPAGDLIYTFAEPEHLDSGSILTLSTCVRGQSRRRLIVRAARVAA